HSRAPRSGESGISLSTLSDADREVPAFAGTTTQRVIGMIECFYIYILASRPGGAIYIGVTSNLIRRICEHKNEITKGHTSKYNIKQLVYYEACDSAEGAILREKQLKKWTRAMKNDLIGAHNPLWEDLYPGLIAA